MIKFYTFILILFLGLLHAYADTIYLKNNSVKKGKVLTITPDRIEYDPAGKVSFDFIERNQIRKIIYDNGKKIYPEEKTNYRDTTEQGIFTKMFSSGTKKEEQAESTATPVYNFKDSIFYLGFVGGWGMGWGDISDKEKALTIQDDSYDDRKTSSESPGMLYGGCELDLMLPTSSFIKYGIKGRFLSVIEDDEEDDFKRDLLFSYKTWQAGPLLHVILFDHKDVALTIQYYALYGKIYQGELNAMPRQRGLSLIDLDKSQYHTTFDGYTLSAGIGPRLILGSSIQVSCGLNINYTFAKFQFDRFLPVYNSDHTSLHAMNIEFVAGIGL